MRRNITRFSAGLAAGVLLAACFAMAPISAGAQGLEGPPPPGGAQVVNRQEDRGTRLTLTWNQVSGVAGYRVYRSDSLGGPYAEVGAVSQDTFMAFPFFLDDSASPGRTYFYRVASVDAGTNNGPQGATVEARMESYRRKADAQKSMICSLTDQRVYCYENGQMINILRCSTGAGGTPTGSYAIQAHRGWVSGCAFWMDWRPNYGMHAWPSYLGGYEENLGLNPMSHGCIRLHPLEAYWPYNWAPDGTALTVTYESVSGLPLNGASCSEGASKISRTWYFAEGYTGAGFREYLLLFNPGAEPTPTHVTFYTEGADPITRDYVVAAKTRFTINCGDVEGVPRASHAIGVVSDRGIVAQRSTYFDYRGRRGGDTVVGAPAAGTTWFFPEGCTAGGFDTYILLYNTRNATNTIDIDYLIENEAPATAHFDMLPLSRKTIYLNDGLGGKSISTKIRSKLPIVAERSEYFAWWLPYGKAGGTVNMGVTKPAPTWYLAEGCTDYMFDEFVLIMNPNAEPALVNIQFYPPNGPVGTQFQVSPMSRTTIHVDDIPGLEHVDASASVSANKDIVIERAMYDDRDSRRGGHCSNGISEPSKTWYFAEGFTGGTFDEYVLLFNPGSTSCEATLGFYGEDGRYAEHKVGLPPLTRVTVHVDGIGGFEYCGNSISIVSESPIVAEQSHYFCMPN